MKFNPTLDPWPLSLTGSQFNPKLAEISIHCTDNKIYKTRIWKNLEMMIHIQRYTENLIFATQIKRRMRDLSRRTENIAIPHMPRYHEVLQKIVDTELHTWFHLLIGFSDFFPKVSILGLHDLHSANIDRYIAVISSPHFPYTRVAPQGWYLGLATQHAAFGDLSYQWSI